jgi:hypothetical protein
VAILLPQTSVSFFPSPKWPPPLSLAQFSDIANIKARKKTEINKKKTIRGKNVGIKGRCHKILEKLAVLKGLEKVGKL